MNRHSIFGVDLGATFLGDISSVDLGMESEWMQAAAASDIYTRFTTLIRQGFKPSFSTGGILAALNVVGTMGADIEDDLTGGIKYYFIKRKDVGGFELAASALHKSFAFGYGYVFPQTLTVNHQGDASLTYGIHAVSSDGTTSPEEIGENVALTDTLSAPVRWALGPVSVGGVMFTGINSLTIHFGLTVQGKSSDDKIYDTGANLERVQPTIVLSGSDLGWVKSSGAIAPAGQACTHGNTTMGLRKRQDKAQFTADTLTFSAAGLAYPNTLASASGLSDATSEITIVCDYDGTNAPIKFAA